MGRSAREGEVHMRARPSPAAARRAVALAWVATLSVGASACTGDDGGWGGSGADQVGVTLITKDSTNPYFVAMQQAARTDAEKNNVRLTIASGTREGDNQGQIDAIEQAIARGDQGILITPMSTGVNAAITKARDARLYVIALDTSTDPPGTVDITFATDNRQAGRIVGRWTAQRLAGAKATIALIDLSDDTVVSVDYERDQGFLDGMGIDVKDDTKNGDEARAGTYTGGAYEIVCNEAGRGDESGGRRAMERCLARNKGITVVYTVNEPSAAGASAALRAAGVDDAMVVSIDGGCAGVRSVKDGAIAATAQQYPLTMVALGMQAIATVARGGERPKTSEGLDFFNTGVALVTDRPVEGVESITSDEGSKLCWGR